MSPRSPSRGGGDDDEVDDASLTAMRSVWLSMRDEDPPAAGMTALLAAARAQAETMQRPSWWQRVLATLRRPPALAFATVVVLVGGAVLVGQRTKDAALEAPVATAPQPPATSRSEGGASAGAGDGDAPASGAPAATTAAPSEAAPGGTALQDGARAQEPTSTPVPARAEREPRAKERRRAATGAPPPAPTTTVTTNGFDATAPKLEASRASGAGGAPRPSATRGSTMTPPATPRPSPPPPADAPAPRTDAPAPRADAPAPRADAPAPRTDAPAPRADAEETTGAGPVLGGPTGAPRAPSLEQLARQAATAAARGDCAAVRVIAARIKREDARFYAAKIATDAAIAKCL